MVEIVLEDVDGNQTRPQDVYTCLDYWPAAISGLAFVKWRCERCVAVGTLGSLSFKSCSDGAYPDHPTPRGLVDMYRAWIMETETRAKAIRPELQQVVHAAQHACVHAHDVLRASFGRDRAVSAAAVSLIESNLEAIDVFLNAVVPDAEVT